MKVCTKCKIEKELSEYSNDKAGKLGKKASCKQCCAKAFKDWGVKNRDHVNSYMRTYTKSAAHAEWRRAYARSYDKTARGRYNAHLKKAKLRGIAWGFTFDSWFAFWYMSGKWGQRGRKGYEYCMGRIGDAGPYTSWNCEIITNEQNRLDATKNGVYTRSATI